MHKINFKVDETRDVNKNARAGQGNGKCNKNKAIRSLPFMRTLYGGMPCQRYSDGA